MGAGEFRPHAQDLETFPGHFRQAVVLAGILVSAGLAGPCPADVVLPSSAFSTGANQASFQTNVRVFNAGPDAAVAVPILYDQATGETVTRPSITVPPRQQVRYDNVLSSLFGRSAPSFGPIRFQTGASSLVVSSSVDNVNACGSGAVSGQWLPGIDASQALTAGVLVQLAASANSASGYRTNVVFLNAGAATATVSAKVRRGDGTLLSSATLPPLAPNGFLQKRLDDGATFPGVAGTTDTNLWLEFTADQPVLSFASVIHNVSGDPFAVVAVKDGGTRPGDVVLPSSAFSTGANQASFQTNVRIFNAGPEAAVAVPILYDQATGETVTRPSITIPPRQQVRYDNVLSSLFGRSAPSFGPIRFQTASSSLVVSSSVDNVNACGSGAVSGQWLPGIAASQALTAGVLVQLAASASSASGYRTNVVFVNAGTATATVSAKVRRGDGTLLSSATLPPLAPNGFLQKRLDDGATFPGVAGTTDTNLWLELTADRPVLSFASVIHNVSGDPFAVVAVKDAGSCPAGFSGPDCSVADYPCDAAGPCSFSADADGNLAAGPQRATAVTVRAGGTITFQGLGPRDQVIEVSSPALTSEHLCTAPVLPAGTAHQVPPQKPTPGQLHPAGELSGPYRTYPAGVFSLSVGSDECGFIEKTTPCAAPNENAVSSQPRAGGGTDYLCSPTRYLMNPDRPGQPANNPPVPNPACVASRTMEATWGDPGIQGLFLRLDWNEINPAYDSYDFSIVDRELTAALRHGKTVTLGVRVGGNSIPDWVFATGDPVLGPARKVRLRDWDTRPGDLPNANCGFEYTVASPSDAAFKSLFKKALTDLAVHLRADQRRFSVLGGVKVTGLGMATLENRLPQRCNIAVANPALGDTGTQGHIVSLDSTSLAQPIFDPNYSISSDPTAARIRDRSLCVCNPQVLQFAGYRPSVVQGFYREVEATLHDNLGYKQMVFMNVSAAFPQVGEGGRFLGDHLAPPILSMTTNAAGDPVYTYGTVYPTRAVPPNDIPEDSEITRSLVVDARNGGYVGGDLVAARGFGVENAALNPIGFWRAPNQGVRCDQQADIAASGTFAGSAAFPIPATARVDASTAGCPNLIATREGIAYDKAGGFQVTNGLQSAAEIDAALWNLTLNTNGLFFELYEQDAWITRKQSAANAGGVLDPAPAVQRELATVNHAAATAKSLSAWNSLLLTRASVFSADPAHANSYQANPYPTSYTVGVGASPGAQRWVFNARACSAWTERGVPVQVNRIVVR